MDTMKSFKVKNMMCVAAFMAVTGIAQATESEAASSDTPITVKDKKTLSLREQAQGKVSGWATQVRNKIKGSEQKATEKVTAKEEKANEKIGRVSATVDAIKNKAAGTASCVRKEVYTAQLTVLQTQAEKAQEMSTFFAEQKKQLDTQIKDTLNKIATAHKACVATGENAEPTE